MKKTRMVYLTPRLKAQFMALPVSASSAVEKSIFHAARQPELLAKAFYQRLSQPFEASTERLTHTREESLDSTLDKLSEMTKLPTEQVIRLCMEAYINRL
jgi:hypothetical protein